MKAFPWLEKLDSTDPTVINPISHGGMDLRDYFASKAMPSLIKPFDNHLTTPRDVAKRCYQYADEMMKARMKDAEVDRNNTLPDRDSTNKS